MFWGTHTYGAVQFMVHLSTPAWNGNIVSIFRIRNRRRSMFPFLCEKKTLLHAGHAHNCTVRNWVSGLSCCTEGLRMHVTPSWNGNIRSVFRLPIGLCLRRGRWYLDRTYIFRCFGQGRFLFRLSFILCLVQSGMWKGHTAHTSSHGHMGTEVVVPFRNMYLNFI
jgi:hypothetical protein